MGHLNISMVNGEKIRTIFLNGMFSKGRNVADIDVASKHQIIHSFHDKILVYFTGFFQISVKASLNLNKN